jgi:hypothetical protein
MTSNADLYKKLGDWFLEHPHDLIPKAGLDYPEALIQEYQTFFDQQQRMLMMGFDLQGNDSRDEYEAPSIAMNDLPLLVAIQSGIEGQQLAAIARHHQVNVKKLFSTLENMASMQYEMENRDGNTVYLSELYIQCVKATSVAFPDELLNAINCEDEHSNIHKASIHSEDSIHWPATRLAMIMKNMEHGSPPPSEDDFLDEGIFNINGSSSSGYMIEDASGIRYDMYLERSGMLLLEVARKKIGNLTLWEDMLQNAMDETDTGMAELFKYCIGNPPEHLRPAILRGLSGMALASSLYLHNGNELYNALRAKVTGTWLEPLNDNLHLIISLMGTDNQFTSFSLSRSLQNKAFAENGGVKRKVQHKTLLEHCLQAMLNVPAHEMGVSHFQIYLLDSANLPEPEFSDGFKPEPIIVHMLKGLEDFSLSEKHQIERAPMIDEFVVKGCTYVAETLAKHFELDYKAFTGLGSRGVRVLAEAGLDKRRLPRMNNRDRGDLVSQELGL